MNGFPNLQFPDNIWTYLTKGACSQGQSLTAPLFFSTSLQLLQFLQGECYVVKVYPSSTATLSITKNGLFQFKVITQL